jgi:hypothetical protein
MFQDFVLAASAADPQYRAGFSKHGTALRDIAPCCARMRRQVLEASLCVGALRVKSPVLKARNL